MDTACSSSLVAANAGRECALSHGSAVTGGINMMLLPSTTDMFQRAGMLTSDGRCKALDAAADGYVRYSLLTFTDPDGTWNIYLYKPPHTSSHPPPPGALPPPQHPYASYVSLLSEVNNQLSP